MSSSITRFVVMYVPPEPHAVPLFATRAETWASEVTAAELHDTHTRAVSVRNRLAGLLPPDEDGDKLRENLRVGEVSFTTKIELKTEV